MSSEAKIGCYWCPSTFSTNRDMKNHAASSDHSKMRVICPWCVEEEKTYRRISELQKHIDKRHHNLTDDLKQTNFFSESNGYWISLHPEDYAKLVKPTPYESMVAMRTRAAVSQWLEKVKQPSRSREEWQQSWDKRREVPYVIPKKTAETGNNSMDKSGNSYSPSRPEMEDYNPKLKTITFDSKGYFAFLLDSKDIGDVWFKVEVSTEVFSDKRAADSLMRRMQSIGYDGSIPSNFSTTFNNLGALKPVITKELGIPEKYIRKIQRHVVAFGGQKKRKLEDLAEELEMSEEEIELMDSEDVVVGKMVKEKLTVATVPDEKGDGPSKDKQETLAGKSMEAAQQETPTTQKAQEIRDEAGITTETISQQKEVKARAGSLLMSGVMPLLPAARREWGSLKGQKTLGTPREIEWPPKDWQELSPEDRLTAWQFAAMTLEFNRGVKAVTNKRELLDRYAMLALPGTSLDLTNTKNGVSHVRLINFNLLKGIYSEQMKDSDAEIWLDTFENVRDNNEDDFMTHLLNTIKDVPLRISSTESQGSTSV